MNLLKKIQFLGLCIIFCAVGFAFKVDASSNSIGASPADIKTNLLLKGSHYEQEIVLSRSDPSEEAKAIIEIEGDEIESWISIDPGYEFALPKGSQRITFKVKIDVPQTAKIANYQGKVVVKMASVSGANGLTIAPGVTLKVDLTVTDQGVGKLVILQSEIQDILSNKDLILIMSIKNEGSIAVKPDKVKLKLSDASKNLLKELEGQSNDTIAPFSTGSTSVSFADLNLTPGTYFADVEVFFQGQSIYQNILSFTVTYADNAPSIERSNLLGIVFGVLLLIFVAIGLWIGILVKKSKKLSHTT